MAYIFLSHSHDDRPFARRMAADLRNSGHSVWIDEAEIDIGDSLIGKIREGLDQVDFVVAILSDASINSPWVERELEIASNRELDEKRVVVLPVLISDVSLPGFLRGKFYGDFRKEDSYPNVFALLLRALGAVDAIPATPHDETKALRQELAAARELAKRHEAQARRAGEAAFHAKSDELKAAIESANSRFPQHAPINRTYAFQIDDDMFVTLDYVLWAIQKAGQRGSHPLEALLTVYEMWPEVDNMLEAYEDMIAQQA